MATTQISLPIPNKDIEDLLLWRNVQKSTLYAGGITTTYLLLEWSNISSITLACNLLFLAIVITALWSQAAKVLHRPGPKVPAVLRNGLDEAQIRGLAEHVRTHVNKVLAILGALLSGTNLLLSAKSAVVLWFAASAGRMFTLLSLAYTLCFFAFTLPKAYEIKKQEIDALLLMARTQVSGVHQKVQAAIKSKLPKSGQNAPAKKDQ